MTAPPSPEAETLEASRAELDGLIKARRFDEALACSDRARRAHPADPVLAGMQAYVRFSLGENETAIAIAREALGLGATHPLASLVLGVASRALGRHEEAAAALQRAHARLPGRADIAALLLEETAAANGLDAARPLHAELAARISDPRITRAWARALFRGGAEAELPEGFRVAPLMSTPQWAAGAGVAMDWVGEPEPIPWLDPHIAGEPEQPRRRSSYLSYTPYVCTIRDAQVFSKSSMVLTPDGAVLHDSTADPAYGRFITNFMSELLIAERDGDRMLLDTGRYAPAGEIDAAILMSGSASEHFGHWLSEYLPRLNLLRRHPRFETLPVLVDEVMPPQHFDYLRLVAPNPLVKLGQGASLRCRELVVAAPTAFYAVHLTPDHGVPPERQGPISVEGLRYIREQVLSRSPPPARTDRKIYISRSKRAGRVPRNEAEICAYLAGRGFDIVYPEEMSFAEQVRLFQESSVVVLANGSAVVNCIFSAPGTRFFVLSQRGLFNWGVGCGWMDAMGYPLTFICDREETAGKHDAYSVAIADLEAGLGEAAAPTAG